jgi:riboflavin kinase/FMN adenylyltransferase
MTPGFITIRDSTPPAAIPRGAVVAMGNFDGVHLGHRAVIAAALQMARIQGRPALAVTFEPHPRRFFSPNTPQFRLTDETAKLRLLAGTGLEGAVVMTFDKNRAGTTAKDFIHHDLIDRLGVSGIAVGYDFHFGKGRVGSPSLLVNEAPRLGIEVDVQPHVDIDERPVSSSAIRMALAEGQIEDATAMLGGPWFITGEISAIPPPISVSTTIADSSTASTRCGLAVSKASIDRASMESQASAADRPSTTARRCSKSFCSISTATSMERRWM